jgi:hypothetical protein
MLNVLYEACFADGDPGRDALDEAWLLDNDHATTDGPARITINLPPATEPLLLELDLQPATDQPTPLTLHANNHAIAADTLCTATKTTLAYPLQPTTILTLDLQTPHPIHLFQLRIIATRPMPPPTQTLWPVIQSLFADTAPQAHAAIIQHYTGLNREAFGLKFESIGSDCEFGFFQRDLGANPMSLFRFNAIDVPALVDGLEYGFHDADHPKLAYLKIYKTTGEEYFLQHHRYGFRMHTNRFAEDIDEASAHREMLNALKYFKTRFREVMLEADRIFVFQRKAPTLPAQMRAILARLQAYGPNKLLWVSEDQTTPPGTVRHLGGGLLHGCIDHLAPPGKIDQYNLPAWTSLCINALRATA